MNVTPIKKELNLENGSECYTYTFEVSTDFYAELDSTVYKFMCLELIKDLKELNDKQK